MCILLLAACSKDKTKTPGASQNPQQQNNLTDDEKWLVGSWKIDYYVDTLYDKSGQVLYDVNAPSACRADDIYTFKADKTYSIDQGKDTCDKFIDFGPWEWSISYGGLNYKHGPNPHVSGNKFTRTDDNHFSVRWSTQGWDGQNVYVYFYKRM
jgi:hypothetical protein